MKTLTLRNVPDDVVEQLAATAKENRQSMNGAAVLALQRALGLDAGPRRKRDLSAFAGAWKKTEFAAFEKATAGFSAIDEELWRR
jgi:plasmid stability protein